MDDPPADGPIHKANAALDRAAETAANALAALDAADVATRDAATCLDDMLAVRRTPNGSEPANELADATGNATAVIARGALDALDDAAARTAAARTALAAASNALATVGTAEPPHVMRILQRALAAAGAGASGSPARKAVNSARKAVNSARKAVDAAGANHAIAVSTGM